jgi:uncharacterized protein YodC (DUF2158 family)
VTDKTTLYIPPDIQREMGRFKRLLGKQSLSAWVAERIRERLGISQEGSGEPEGDGIRKDRWGGLLFVGDAAQLVSGGPQLTVTDTTLPGEEVSVTWFDKQDVLRHDVLSSSLLVRINRPGHQSGPIRSEDMLG